MTQHPQLEEQRLPAAIDRVRGVLQFRVRFFDPLNVQVGGFLVGLSVGDQAGKAAWGVWRLIDPLAPIAGDRDGECEARNVELPEIAGGYADPEQAVLRAWLLNMEESLTAAVGEDAPSEVETVAPTKLPANSAERRRRHAAAVAAAAELRDELRWLKLHYVPIADVARQEALRDAFGCLKYLTLCLRDVK